MAHSTWQRGDLPEAEKLFRDSLLTEGEDHNMAWCHLGGVLVALERLDEAATCYREALALSPDYEIAQTRLEDVEAALKIQEANG